MDASSSSSSSKKNVHNPVVQEKGKHVQAEADAVASTSQGIKGIDIKKILVVKELPEQKSGLKPLKLRLVKTRAELALYSSKKTYSRAVNKTSSTSQVCTPGTSYGVKDRGFNSTPSGISNKKAREFFVTRTWFEGETKYTEFVGKEDTDILIAPEPEPLSSDKETSEEGCLSIESVYNGSDEETSEEGCLSIGSVYNRKNPNKMYEITEMPEVPENIFDSSDEETPGEGYLRIGSVYYGY